MRAAKLTNSGSWWGRDGSSDEHLVGTKHGFLKCRSVRRKPPGEQWSRRETVVARGTKCNFDGDMDLSWRTEVLRAVKQAQQWLKLPAVPLQDRRLTLPLATLRLLFHERWNSKGGFYRLHRKLLPRLNDGRGRCVNVCTKNLALQIEQGNLWNCLKTFASSMLTIEQVNL